LSLGKQAIGGAGIVLLIRLFQRGVGIISMLILARLLAPEDFGVVAIATLVVYFFDALSDNGGRDYIVQKRQVDAEDLNSAWSLNLVLKLAVWLLFLVSVPLLTAHYERTDLDGALFVISLVLPIGTLVNPGLWLFTREINYRPLLKMAAISRTVSFVVVVALAVVTKSYWAMIVGIVIEPLVNVTVSRYLHPHVPAWSFARVSKQWDFTKWVLMKGLVGYARAELDSLLVASRFPLQEIGGYTLMRNLSAMPVQQVAVPASEPLMAIFAKIKDDTARIAEQVRIAVIVIFAVMLPFTFLMWQFDRAIVTLILGAQWIEYAPILGLLSLALIPGTILTIFHRLCVAQGAVRFIFIFDLFSTAVVIGVLVGWGFKNIYEFALLRTVLSIGLPTTFCLLVAHKFSLSFSNIKLALLWCIGAALLVTPIAQWGLDAVSAAGFPVFIQLCVATGIFGVLYCSMLYLLFRVQRGRAEIEYVRYLILSVVKKITGKLRKIGR
jgi:lipopolysaccharide exporter